MGLTPAPGSGYGGRVFVDAYSRSDRPEDVRPILFFAATDAARAASPCGNPFTLADNEAILRNRTGGRPWAPADYAARFDKYLRYSDVIDEYVDGFVLISAGPDRQFFTDDDIIVYAERLDAADMD
jgi:hypothetical protein